jgi:hypothetical protein
MQERSTLSRRIKPKGKSKECGSANEPGQRSRPRRFALEKCTHAARGKFRAKDQQCRNGHNGRADHQVAPPGQPYSIGQDGAFPVRDAQALHEKGMPAIEDQNRQFTHDLRGEKGTHECCNDDAGKAQISEWLWSHNPSSWRSSSLHGRQRESGHESQTKPAYRLRNHCPGPIASCEAYAPMALAPPAARCVHRARAIKIPNFRAVCVPVVLTGKTGAFVGLAFRGGPLPLLPRRGTISKIPASSRNIVPSCPDSRRSWTISKAWRMASAFFVPIRTQPTPSGPGAQSPIERAVAGFPEISGSLGQ